MSGPGAMMKRVVLAFFPRVQAAAIRLSIRVGERRVAHGLTLVDLTQQQEAGPLFAAVEEALRIIAEHDPARLRRMRGDVKHIAIMHTADSAGEWWRLPGVMVLAFSHIQRAMPLSLAMTIVHEATHARIDRMGAIETDKEREERFCVAQEIVFARRVPGSERLIECAPRKLETEYWKQTGTREYQARRLKALGTPPIMRRFLLWLHT